MDYNPLTVKQHTKTTHLTVSHRGSPFWLLLESPIGIRWIKSWANDGDETWLDSSPEFPSASAMHPFRG